MYYLCTRFSQKEVKFDLPNARRDVAQSGSATVWGTGGRKFESCHPDKHKENQEPMFLIFLLARAATKFI